MSNLFKVGGVSKTKGQYKVRFANDMTRVKILAKTDTDINLIELPNAMTKPEVVSFLKTSALYLNADYAVAIDAADVKYNDAGTVKVTGTKPSLDAIKARGKKTKEVSVKEILAAVEDAPF
jgi:Ni,Fe-hydrogenase maturation factor